MYQIWSIYIRKCFWKQNCVFSKETSKLETDWKMHLYHRIVCSVKKHSTEVFPSHVTDVCECANHQQLRNFVGSFGGSCDSCAIGDGACCFLLYHCCIIRTEFGKEHSQTIPALTRGDFSLLLRLLRKWGKSNNQLYLASTAVELHFCGFPECYLKVSASPWACIHNFSIQDTFGFEACLDLSMWTVHENGTSQTRCLVMGG